MEGKVFSYDEVVLLSNSTTFIEEVYVSTWKGVPQTFYVIEIEEGQYWSDEEEDLVDIPEEYIGLWKQEFEDDNQDHYTEAMQNDTWVKCQIKEETIFVYEELY
jgi:hypothetical protein